MGVPGIAPHDLLVLLTQLSILLGWPRRRGVAERLP